MLHGMARSASGPISFSQPGCWRRFPARQRRAATPGGCRRRSVHDPGDRRRAAGRGADPPVRLVPEALARAARHVGDAERAKDQGAVVFLGDSITQGWGRARRGLPRREDRQSRHQRRHHARRADPAEGRRAGARSRRRSCCSSAPTTSKKARRPEIIAGNLKLILAELKRHNPRMPVILCQVFPSSATMKRPADQIKAINALYLAAVKDDPQVIPLDTWRVVCRRQRRRAGRGVSRPAASERGRLREVGGGAPAAACDAAVRGDRRRTRSRRRRGSRACSTAAI